jgi:diadenosine tetraphosphatase ApaH/serine/threonine PP2A family protein phosphatase
MTNTYLLALTDGGGTVPPEIAWQGACWDSGILPGLNALRDDEILLP